MLDDGPRRAADRLGFTDEEIDGGGLRVTTTFTKKAMDAAEEGVLEAQAGGLRRQAAAHRCRRVEPGTGAVRGFYGGQDYLDSQINWAVAGGQAGSTFKPFALAAAHQGRASRSRTPSRATRRIELADGTDVENQGDDRLRLGVSLLTATENSINTAFIDLTAGMDERAEKIIETAERPGHPAGEAGQARGPASPATRRASSRPTGVALGSQTVSPINMANAYATIANGGGRAEPLHHREGRRRRRRDALQPQGRGPTGRRRGHRRRRRPTRCSRSSRPAPATAALGARPPGRRQDRHRHQRRGEVSSAWFAGFTPQLATAVMYVRGEGNGQLDGWLPSYFGGDYPAETWTAVMHRGDGGRSPIEEFPPAGVRRRRRARGGPRAVHAAAAADSRPRSRRRTEDADRRSRPTPTEPTRRRPSRPPTAEPTTPSEPTAAADADRRPPTESARSDRPTTAGTPAGERRPPGRPVGGRPCGSAVRVTAR